MPSCRTTLWLWFEVSPEPVCAGRRVPRQRGSEPSSCLCRALTGALRWVLRSRWETGSPVQSWAQLSTPSKYLPFFNLFFLKRLCCHMALAVLPSAWHCCLATLPDLQNPKILTLGSARGTGAAAWGEMG